MIFVTVGSDVPFNRLIKQVDFWSRDHPGQPMLAQIGRLEPSDYSPTAMDWTEMVQADQFDRHCAEARLIVAHAGMGSIISALASGTPIVILPRSARLKETRNDHQFATAKRFAGRPGIFVAWTEAELADVIDQALCGPRTDPAAPLSEFAPAAFTDRLREFILDDGRPSQG